MTAESHKPTVTHLRAAARFEIVLGSATAHLDYQLAAGHMTIHHTFVPRELRGQHRLPLTWHKPRLTTHEQRDCA